MIYSIRSPALQLLPVLSVFSTDIAIADNLLSISASSPVVSIETRDSSKNFIRLPSLEYVFSIDAQCDAELAPKTISLSVADTRISVSSENVTLEIIDDVALRVPSDQIGPVALESFCTESESESRETKLLTMSIPAVLSAQASLLCVSESHREISYTSVALDVTLECNQPALTTD